MDVFLQAVVVIGAVVIGVRFGSIGLGICGGGGLMTLIKFSDCVQQALRSM